MTYVIGILPLPGCRRDATAITVKEGLGCTDHRRTAVQRRWRRDGITSVWTGRSLTVVLGLYRIAVILIRDIPYDQQQKVGGRTGGQAHWQSLIIGLYFATFIELGKLRESGTTVMER
jgi:hypothetical protein